MPVRLLRQRWESPPPGPVQIARDHPRADGLVFAAPLSGADDLVDLVGGQRGARTGLEQYAPNDAGGQTLLFGSGSYADFATPPPEVGATTPFSIAWTQEPRSGSGYVSVAALNFAPGLGSFLIYQAFSDSSYFFVAGPRIGSSTPAWSSNVGAATNGRLDRFVIRGAGGPTSTTAADWTLYSNGVAVARSGSAALSNTTAAIFRIGARDGAADAFRGHLSDFRIWSRVLTDAEAEAESTVAGSWDLYAPRRIWVPVSAGGAPTWDVSLTESATASDAVSETYSSAADLTETASAADTLTAATTWVRTLTEAATAADTLTAATTWVRTLTEPASAADTVAHSYSAVGSSSLTETAALADTVTSAATWVRTLTESASPADVVTAVIQAVATLTEAAALADSQSTGSVYVRDVTEPASAADALAAAATLVAQLAEAAAAGDTASSAATWVRVLTEPATAADSVAGGAPGVYAVTLTELAAAVDLIAAVLTGVDTPLDRPLFERLAAGLVRRVGMSRVTAGARRIGDSDVDGPAAH